MSASLAHWIEANQKAAIALVLSVLVFGFGLYKLIPALTAGGVTRISIADLLEGKKPASGVVEVSGYPKTSYSVVRETELGGKMTPTTRFLPLVAAGWRPSEPVAVFLEVQKRYEPQFRQAQEKATYRGRMAGSLDGPVRYRMRQAGLSLTPDHRVIQFNVDPAEARNEGLVIALIGVGIGLFGVMLVVVQRRRRQ